MEANKTDSAVIIASKVAPGIHRIKSNFDKTTKIHLLSRTRSEAGAKDDEMLMFKDFHKLRPFRNYAQQM